MRALYLLRHGQTAANAAHIYCGATDLPLCDAGRAMLSPRALPLRAPRYYSSGMRRANETLQILFGDVPYTIEPRLREIDFGIFEMHAYDELQNRADYQAWISGDNERNVPPGGESGEQMQLRAFAALREIAAETDEAVILTHGGVICAVMQAIFPQEGRSRYDWQPYYGRGYAIFYDTDGNWRYEQL